VANTFDPRIAGDQFKNRTLLLEGLARQGFVNYDKEWWHFTYAPAGLGEPYPDTFFDFPVAPGPSAPGPSAPG
jgi:D-alanyl-D-alanine dipeptidase